MVKELIDNKYKNLPCSVPLICQWPQGMWLDHLCHHHVPVNALRKHISEKLEIKLKLTL